MYITTGKEQLGQLIARQIGNNFLLDAAEEKHLKQVIPPVLQRVEACFVHSANKYYRDDDGALCFNPFHSAQYTFFLYFLSRELASDNPGLADKVYYLNRMLNGLDLFHQVEMPPVFMLDHPLGTVLGRATYGNFFVFSQNCTVGGNHGIYPVLGEYVTLFAGATVIGNSRIGNNVYISAGAYVKDEDIPGNCIVFGRSPGLVLKHKPASYFHRESPFLDHRPDKGP